MSSELESALPIESRRVETDASHLVIDASTNKASHLICEIEIEPNRKEHLSLGDFDSQAEVKGFSIEVNPPSPEVITQITRLESKDGYELVLHIVNQSKIPICAEIWRH